MSERTDLLRLTAALADRYRVERELGAGGMATVYLAEDLKHDRKVAIKVLKPELAAVLGAERFVVEIKTTAALQHPHILPLFDSGEAGGFLYYVMPYIKGETIREKLTRETQCGVDEAVRITREIADALDYAHRHGVIHRDIKPENILLHDGRAMVMDFGIALAVSAAAGARITETGLSLGTPHYMSPEQATADKEISGRSDVYSLASVLYEMLAGQPPHLGGSAQQIIMKIIAEPVALVTTLRKSVPAHVTSALAMALEKLPADRFESARAFGEALANPAFRTDALETAAAGGGIAASSHIAAIRTLGATLVLAAVLAVWGWLRPVPSPPVSSYTLAMSDGRLPVVAPDGSYMVYVGPIAEADGQQLWMKRRDRYQATPIAGTVGAAQFEISPDGASVAFVTVSELKSVSLGGSAPTKLVGQLNGQGLGLAWLDDANIVYGVGGTGGYSLWSIPVGGGAPSPVVRPDSGNAYLPVALPGGRGFLFALCSAAASCDTYTFDSRSKTTRLVLPGTRRAVYVPTGHLLYVYDRALMAVPFDLGRLEVTGASVQMAENVLDFSISRSGVLVQSIGAAVGTMARYRLVWVDRGGNDEPVDTTFTFSLTRYGGNAGWALSSDATQLAVGLSGEDGDDIWVKPLPRGPASRLTTDGAPDFRPRWTSDGRFVTFASARGGASGVYMRRADGTGSDSLLFSTSTKVILEAALTPDGRQLLMRLGGVAGPGGRDIVGLKLGIDTVPTNLLASRFDEASIALSPEGSWIAYHSDETGKAEIFIRSFPDINAGRWQVSSGGGLAPVWSRDGKELFYLDSANDMMSVRLVPGGRPPGNPVRLFHVADDLLGPEHYAYAPWAVAPDGRFLMAQLVRGGQQTLPSIVLTENFFEELKVKVPR